MVTKRFENWKLEDVIPYENNPRKNDQAVDDVAESIRQTGNLDPIEVDENGVILSGHTRLKALKKLKYTHTDVVVYEGLTEEQKSKYRLLANKTGEKAAWDIEKLEEELVGLDFLGYDFGFGLSEEESDDGRYTTASNIPQYEPEGDKPDLSELLDTTKTESLMASIDNAEGITEEERIFLKAAAGRHNVFNYKHIAEYYCNATHQMQRLMEESALVIIDVDNAIAHGYARLSEDILSLMEDEDDEG